MARVTSNYWDFIMDYLPYYSSDNRVLKSDILFRFLDNDEIAEEDIVNIKREYKSIDAVIEELKRIDKALFSESMDAYYKDLKQSCKENF